MRNKIILLVLLLASVATFAQKKVTWQDLADVEFEDKFFEAGI